MTRDFPFKTLTHPNFFNIAAIQKLKKPSPVVYVEVNNKIQCELCWFEVALYKILTMNDNDT